MVQSSTTWDPDGAGPAGLQLVCAGRITAGHFAHHGVGAWDGTQWLALGTPPDGDATAVVVYQNELVAAFQTAYALSTIAAWNGTTWRTLGTCTGSFGSVSSFAVHQGSLYVGGMFTAANGTAATNVARFDGVTWSSAGSGQADRVTAMVSFGSALHVATYDTTTFGGRLSTWNGVAWTSIATSNRMINSFAVHTTTAVNSSLLFVGGSFTQWTSSNGTITAARVVRYSMSTGLWTALGSNLTGSILALSVRLTGVTGYELVAVQNYLNEGLWQWNNTTWVQQGSGLWNPVAVSLYNGLYHVSSYGGPPVVVQRLQAGVWSQVQMATTALGVVRAVLDAGPEVVVGGDFGLRQGNPGAWHLVGGLTGFVQALARMPNGDLVVGGAVLIPGGSIQNQIVRWNGTSWSSIATGINGTLDALLVLPGGGLIAGGSFTALGGVQATFVAQWNGTAWSPMSGGMNAEVRALARLPNGLIFAGGDFTLAGSLIGYAPYIAQWNGSSWSPVGGVSQSLQSPVHALAVRDDGQLVVATDYFVGTSLFHALRWNGSYYTAVPADFLPNALLPLPDGDLLLGSARVTRLTGSNLVDHATDGQVLAMARAANGDVLVGGDFRLVDATGSVGFARLGATCPATAVSVGAGCSGLAGPTSLQATALPWLGATFRATATGLPPQGIAFVVTGLSGINFPLQPVLPVAATNCILLVATDAVELALPTNGAVAVQLAIPDSPALVGLMLRHQVLGFRFDALGQLNEVTVTNALQSTIGAF